MGIIISEENQTIYDLAVQYYGTVEAVSELLALNPDIRNDAKGQDVDVSDFHFDLPIAGGSQITLDAKSPLLKKHVTKELQGEHITTWQEWLPQVEVNRDCISLPPEGTAQELEITSNTNWIIE